MDKYASEHDARVAIIVENIITYGGAHISVVVRYNNTETNDFEDYEAQETVYGTDYMELSIVAHVHIEYYKLSEMSRCGSLNNGGGAVHPRRSIESSLLDHD